MPDGREFGAEYQALCAQSWRAAGFSEVVSVNSRRELEAFPQIYEMGKQLGVRILSVERDASDVVGRPQVYIADLMRLGAEIAGPDGIITFVNADIMFAAKPKAVDIIKAHVKPGQFALARRVPVDTPDGEPGDPYFWGFDVFAGRAADFAAAPDIGLIVGCHWWDHIFPSLVCCAGNQLVHIEEPFAIHLEHEERASDEIRAKLGFRFLRELKLLFGQRPWKTEAAAIYEQGLLNAFYDKTGRPFRDFAKAVRRRIPPYLQRESGDAFYRMAAYSVEFLDRYKTAGAAKPTNEAPLRRLA